MVNVSTKMAIGSRLRRLTLVGMAVAMVVTTGVASTAQADEPTPASPGNAEVETDQFGNWSSVGAAPGSVLTQAAPGADPVQTATAVLNDFTPGLGVTDGTSAFVAREPRTAQDGGPVVRYAQTVNGIPVFGSGVAVRLTPDNAALSVSSSIVPTARTAGMDLAPTIDQNAAIELARTAIPRDENGSVVDPSLLTPTTPEMMIYDPDLIGGDPNADSFAQARLVWSLSLTSVDPRLSYRFLIDAVEPAVLLTFSEIEQGLDRKVCDDNSTDQPVVCRDEGNPAVPGFIELNGAYDMAEETYNYFKTTFSRDSYDNKGGVIKIETTKCPFGAGCPWGASQWVNGEHLMEFGEGWARADDMIGHEFTHGITESESNLMYYAESGAISESISDVFGEIIDQKNDYLHTDLPNLKWQIGEDIVGGPLRSMKDPPVDSNPDRVLSPYYWKKPADNWGVHFNSGISNKAAYLLAQGGTFNGQTVGRIGNDQTAAIYYEANASVLTPGSDYRDLFFGLQRACKNLIGTNGITSNSCDQVKKAVTATEMNLAPKQRLNASRACNSGRRSVVFVDDAESGFGKWVSSNKPSWTTWTVSKRASQSGTHGFFGPNPAGTSMKGPGYSSWMRTKNRIKVPWTGTSYLWFAHNFDIEDGWDGGVVEYSLDGRKWLDLGPDIEAHGYNGTLRTNQSKNPIKGKKAFTGESRGFQQSRASLGKLRGKKVFLRFRIGADQIGRGWGWHIDDVTVYNCSSVKANFGSGYQQITPRRLIDTRSNAGLVKVRGIRKAGSVLRFNAASLPIYQKGHKPTALNLTVTMASNTGPGHVTVYPCGKRPTTSTLNATSAGLIVVNTATIPIAANGDMCIYNHAKTHLIVDVAGYQTSSKGSRPPSRYQAMTPRRLVDTRNGNGLVKVRGARKAGSVLQIDIANLGLFRRNTTPRALDLTITAANNSGPGHVTAYPCGKRPNTTVLNTYRPKQVVSNTATVPVSGQDKFCIYTHMATDLIVDISGYHSPTRGPKLGTYRPLRPRRVLDTRNNNGLFKNKGIRPAGSTLKINLNKLGIIKSGQKPTAYDLTFTMILNQEFGHITAYPCGGTKPTAATMTAAQPNMVIANTATIPVNANGEICVYTNPRTHLTIDVTGYDFK